MMKGIRTSIFRLVPILLLAAACVKEEGGGALPGEGIVFRASSEYDNGPETKTVYSGVEYGGKERIDWVTGDRIRIFSDKARHPSGTQYSDYQVTGVTPGTGSAQAISYASVKNVGNNGLHWGTGVHHFYAVYPSPEVNSNISVVNFQHWNMTLPKNQLQAAQMDYAYMAASVQTNVKATVNLSFKPMFTAFQFTVRSESDASMTITSFSLSTGENKAMAGSCDATPSPHTNTAQSTLAFSNFTPYSQADGNNTITVDMGAGVTVTPTSFATITVFALPQDYSQLTASFTTRTGETKSLKLQDAQGQWVTFQAGHKYNITGLGLPGAWTYTVSSIDDIIRDGEQVLYDYDKDVTVTIRRSRTGSTTQNLPWKAYFTTASDPTAVAGASAVGKSWSETPLQDADGNDWLTLSAYSGTGDANNVKVSLAANELPPTAIDLMTDAQAMTNAMNANNLGTVDLSRVAFNGSAFAYSNRNPANTANCYVINGYGTFYIPLVYGNGIQNGSPANAYVGVADANCLETFINADGQPITSDFILQDANLTKSGQYEARIVWQDVAAGFQIIRDSDVAFVPAGSSELSGVAALNCDYLKFRVRQYQSQVSGRGIKPGNAVFALYDKGEDKILWSWHLWFTNEAFYLGDALPPGVQVQGLAPFLSAPIGWAPPISYYNSDVPQRSQKVIVVNTYDNKVAVAFNVIQKQYERPSYPSVTYSPVSFQLGRKDPFLANTDLTMYSSRVKQYSSLYYDQITNKIKYNLLKIPTPSIPGDEDELSIEIQNPHYPIAYDPVFYPIPNSTYNAQYRMVRYMNLWGGPEAGPLNKTIYDPSPSGFIIPNPYPTASQLNGYVVANVNPIAGEVNTNGRYNEYVVNSMVFYPGSSITSHMANAGYVGSLVHGNHGDIVAGGGWEIANSLSSISRVLSIRMFDFDLSSDRSSWTISYTQVWTGGQGAQTEPIYCVMLSAN